jgi:diguanylate cyclase (GGDEF)-like protein/PAS domain S-box-containing protein
MSSSQTAAPSPRFRRSRPAAASPPSVAHVDGDLRLRAASGRLEGRPAAGLVGRPLPEVLPDEAWAELEPLCSRALAGETLAVTRKAADGCEQRTTLEPVREDGDVVGALLVTVDATEDHGARAEAAATRDLIESAFATTPVGVLVSRRVGPDRTRVLRVNRGMAAMLGLDPAEAVGRDGAELVIAEDQAVRRGLLRSVTRDRPATGDLRLRRADGGTVVVHAVVTEVDDPRAGEVLVVQALDVTDRRRLEERLRHLADHDELTGLLSRTRFTVELHREVARVARSGRPACLLVLGLDGFKAVNDAYGHAAGDALLVAIARGLRAATREIDVLARVAGDEFAVVLPDTDAAGGRAAAAKLAETARRHGRALPDGTSVEITASVGLAPVTTDPDPDPEALLVEADLALDRAKQAGRGAVAVHAHRGTAPGPRSWVGALREALRAGRLVLHAQPVRPLAAGDGRERHELLLRLPGPDGTLIAPGAFLADAERHGMVVDLDRWVLRQAVERLHAAHGAGRDLTLAVNLSARSVQAPQLVADLAAMLEEHPVRPGSLVAEVTETTAITDMDRAGAFARDLRALGLRVALDDFGVGFAGLDTLKHLTPDLLKIDGSFVEPLPGSATDLVVVRAAVGIARGLGAQVVAERVGDAATAELLTAIGVDFGQGFFLGRPRPLEVAGHPAARL